MNWRYTSIQHGPRLELGLSPNEYCVLDVFYQTQSSPIYSVDGWSENTYKQLSEFLGFSTGAIHKMVDRFVKSGLMEVNPANPKQKKTTDKWFLVAYERLDSVQKVNESRSLSERPRSKSERVHSKSERHIEEIEIKEKLNTNTKEESACDPDSIPVSSYSTANMNDFLAAGEKCYDNIHSRIKAYFTNEEKASALVESAGCKMDAREFNSELTGWVRHNMTRQEFYCNPIKFLRGGKGNFYSWISQPFKPYHKNSPARIEKELEPLKRPTAEQLSR